MVGVSQGPSRHERREWWRHQLARQQSGSLSVTEFCRRLGVSLTTFYYWKKRFSEAAPDTSRREPARRSTRPGATSTDAAVPSFMPVSIVDPVAGTQLEITLANACVVRLRGTVDPSLLQAAIAAAGQLDGSHQGAD
jgi:hypothetical protein